MLVRQGRDEDYRSVRCEVTVSPLVPDVWTSAAMRSYLNRLDNVKSLSARMKGLTL
jgi:hypothetical protein